jgi:hypothetical protein
MPRDGGAYGRATACGGRRWAEAHRHSVAESAALGLVWKFPAQRGDAGSFMLMA